MIPTRSRDTTTRGDRHPVSPSPKLRRRRRNLWLLLWAVVGVSAAPAVAQFQQAIRSPPRSDRRPQVECPTINLNGEPILQRHPVQGEPETIVPPLVPPGIEPSPLPAETADATLNSPLEQMRQERQRRMEEILRRLQMYREQLRTGSQTTTDRFPTTEPFPAMDMVGGPDDPADGDVPVPPDDSAAVVDLAPPTDPSDPSAMTDPAADVATSMEQPATDAGIGANGTDNARQRFTDLMNSLTQDGPPEQESEEPPPAEGPGYLAATTVLDSPVDRLRLADNLFATGEVQLALTMYEAVNSKELMTNDRHWLTYQQACCQRRLGDYGAAESVYRQLAGNSDAGEVSVLSRWWLERLEDKKQLEIQAEQIRTVLGTYNEAQANDTTNRQ